MDWWEWMILGGVVALIVAIVAVTAALVVAYGLPI